MVRIRGLIKIRSVLRCETGLRIGGTPGATEIGGVENVIVKDPLTQLPYIPGSSLKGAMRSKYELFSNAKLTDKLRVRLHVCGDLGCDICTVFGTLPELVTKAQSRQAAEGDAEGAIVLTRLRVADAHATDDTLNSWKVFGAIEVKGENALDRLTSKANPRWVERVPRGSEFDVRMSYFVFESESNDWKRDVERLRVVFESMKLVEEDYLGGYGSRGYGRVRFKDISLTVHSRAYFRNPKEGNATMRLPESQGGEKQKEAAFGSLDDVLEAFEQLRSKIIEHLKSSD